MTNEIKFSETHWDCECKLNYIHPNTTLKCVACNTTQAEQPPSRFIEVQTAYKDVDAGLRMIGS